MKTNMKSKTKTSSNKIPVIAVLHLDSGGEYANFETKKLPYKYVDLNDQTWVKLCRGVYGSAKQSPDFIKTFLKVCITKDNKRFADLLDKQLNKEDGFEEMTEEEHDYVHDTSSAIYMNVGLGEPFNKEKLPAIRYYDFDTHEYATSKIG